ncbi:SRPBCC family protein [Hoyosella rhizosphaerae]|uniref:SRPBCC family protein n=1 Tax=Hoyosella rhizosphaerae TaxID=1755582 RepID=UPI00197D39B6|nr:SRPBCC family protein [Hoyosella rhizosphaerae]MBN4925457.1 SRPBCC family protein [Hoyosella rhizosphaerae]
MTAESSIDIKASADRVYDIVSDVTRQHEWAVETESCHWLDGATGPASGARFRGNNQRGPIKWSSKCEVKAAKPGREFTFLVRIFGQPGALWSYVIEPTETGCRVTESTRRVAPRPVALWMNRLALGIKDRDAHNQRNIEQTLQQLKAYAEA